MGVNCKAARDLLGSPSKAVIVAFFVLVRGWGGRTI